MVEGVVALQLIKLIKLLTIVRVLPEQGLSLLKNDLI